MPSLKTIRNRITSTKATQKITRAMKMVAGARLTRAQQRIVSMRPYALKTAEVLRSVAGTLVETQSPDEPVHPLLAQRPEKRTLLVVVSSDRGLCGALNTNINKSAERAWHEKATKGVDVAFVTLGRKGREHFARRRAPMSKDFARVYDGLDLSKARGIARWLVPRFERGEFDSVYVVFSEFKSAITQRVVVERLLPVGEPRASGTGERENVAPTDILYEPNRGALLDRLVPMYVEISLYRALLETQASFFGAQMTAMDAATRNATDLIASLTLQYNRARQAAITKELMEIIGGAEALSA
ncbi:MAG: ATP synthase F1 subunit gamma [Myxococcota bacterium]|nr:ATP synthase F1 subunit gamma [Myxococcota bacterium]